MKCPEEANPQREKDQCMYILSQFKTNKKEHQHSTWKQDSWGQFDPGTEAFWETIWNLFRHEVRGQAVAQSSSDFVCQYKEYVIL
jgi:hypothetical protein